MKRVALIGAGAFLSLGLAAWSLDGQQARASAAVPSPADIVYVNAEVGNTTFSHASHGGRNPNCGDCHPDPFEMKKSETLPMADMYVGKSCGKCHKTEGPGFDAKECAKCHIK